MEKQNIMKKLLLLALFTLAAGGRIIEPIRYELPPMPVNSTRASTVLTYYVQQPLDHFDPHNNAQWNMRFMENGGFWGGEGSPILLMAGGEWSISESWLLAGTMFEAAQENRAYIFYTEHRYYGLSRPFADTSAETLLYLNIDQALADLAYFVRGLRVRFPGSKIVMFGGSYAANMVLWFQKKYGHLVDGVVGSSGPLLAKADFHEYLEVVESALLSEGGETCVENLDDALQEMRMSLETTEGVQRIVDAFSLCQTFDTSNRYDVEYLFAAVTWTLSGAVQTAFPESLVPLCAMLADASLGATPFLRLGRYIGGDGTSCWTNSFDALVNSYSNTDYASTFSTGRLWYYQTCTEYGFYQTGGNTGSVFDGLISLDFYVEICKRAFGEQFNETLLDSGVTRSNLVFGGLGPEVSGNAVNVHGLLDPWHALGVLHELGPRAPTLLVPRASHCFDLRGWQASDTVLMTKAKLTVKELVRQWFNE